MLNNSNPILVLDSGIGGINLLKSMTRTFPKENFIYFADNEYMPYGNKNEKSLLKRIDNIVENMIRVYNAKMVILACNTASTICLKSLRAKYKTAIYGVNPTNLTTKRSLILCTRLTAKAIHKSHDLANLLDKIEYEKILSLPRLASFIENNLINLDKLENKVKEITIKYNLKSYKSIVLGCTHYEFLYKFFKKYLPESKIICPSNNTIQEILKSKCCDNSKTKSQGNVYFLSSSPSKSYIDKLYYIFNKL